MSSEFTVVGRRYVNSAGIVVTQFSFYNNSGDVQAAYQPDQNTTSGEVFVNVNIRIQDGANSQKAREAAANVAAAIATIIAAAAVLPASTPIPLPGNQLTSLGTLVDNLQRTTFLITDTIKYNNQGVGGADQPTMSDQLYFAAFADDSGQRSYTEARWNGEGVIGTVLHELGHLSNEGYGVLQDEMAKYNQETAVLKVPANERDFYNSPSGRDYGLDVETYAQKYAESAAAALGIDISTYSANMVNGGAVNEDFQGGQAIYDGHLSSFDE